MENMKAYYYSDGKEKFGPFNLEELKKHKINEDTLVWYKGLEKWRFAKNIPELLTIIEQNKTAKSKAKVILESYEAKREDQPSKKSSSIQWKLLGVIALLLIFVVLFKFLGVDYSLPDETESANRFKSDSFYINKIEHLINAEDERNFKKVYTLFAKPMSQYWDLYYPDSLQLKKKYDYAWSLSSHSKNNADTIFKIKDQTYDLFTRFTYYSKKKKRFITNKSRIRFVFDKKGKIDKTYSINISNKDYDVLITN
ncbi:DUF4339 domain-containing protein [Flavobacteriaceae bacterium 144Ye]|nr:DUF4339 domain-containing protein [Flavobacteriaceae bacterium 144Ye]